MSICESIHTQTHTHARANTVTLDSSLSLRLCLSSRDSLFYIITRVAPHCVNTLRILHAAYDATNTTRPLVNTHIVYLSVSSPLSRPSRERDIIDVYISQREKTISAGAPHIISLCLE